MEVNKELIIKVAKNARLHLSDEEINRARAMNKCGTCLRQPNEVRRFSAQDKRTDEWNPINSMDALVILSLQSSINRLTYSSEAIKRIESFWHNYIFNVA